MYDGSRREYKKHHDNQPPLGDRWYGLGVRDLDVQNKLVFRDNVVVFDARAIEVCPLNLEGCAEKDPIELRASIIDVHSEGGVR